jgi:capsule polysaccharide export protein KpsE/RkpR
MDATQEVLIQWQQKLGAAQRDLHFFEEQLGELALSNDANDLAEQLAQLRASVAIAEAAVKTASSKVGDPRIGQKRAQLEQARTQLAECNAQAASWEATYQKIEPKFIEARDRMISAAQMAMRHENSVMHYQGELDSLLREQGTK